ncbi:hypothetical protein HYPSUDRAFT_204495 [Hypholoma sublateritium FD-334 SS-4]|uniref:Fungal lipase-type domain-containing protein n=1 Tax=Hypholoma sublateritium (strain FD-334 SS-4) TaxID=945553 RepID=A0A0D2NL77_HYPSF|nr:hypothetical protein HYPSUDRAFT_204495 [Hypholoma sublateritium FD-334 SS-4]
MRRDTITALSTTQITSFDPFTHYASTGYCDPALTRNWTCGANCDANPTFKPVASGGDGAVVQYWFVGYDLTLQTVIVGHQGTVASKILPILTDADFFLRPLSTLLFPGIPAGIEVHDGFGDAQERSAAAVLAAVQLALKQSGLNQVTLVGHSLGAAITLLDSVCLQLALPTVQFRVVSYGMPRVGNQAFATYVSGLIGSIDRVNNKQDLVPILPGRFLGFHHVIGEKHIQANNSWVACPGIDNTDPQCTTGAVKNLFYGNADDHMGPYDGITLGC